jgi:DNA-binding MarR family transcriptional regulator
MEAALVDAAGVDRATASRRVLMPLDDSLNAILHWANRHEVQTQVMRRANCTLPLSNVWLLARIQHSGPCHPSDLASFHGVDNSTITPKLQRLEADGLVRRRPDPDDRRAVLVEATAAGCRLLKRLRRARAGIVEEALASLPSERRQLILEVLGDLAVRLEIAGG